MPLNPHKVNLFLESKKFLALVFLFASLFIAFGSGTYYNGWNKGVVWGKDCGVNFGIEFQGDMPNGAVAMFWNNCD